MGAILILCLNYRANGHLHPSSAYVRKRSPQRERFSGNESSSMRRADPKYKATEIKAMGAVLGGLSIARESPVFDLVRLLSEANGAEEQCGCDGCIHARKEAAREIDLILNAGYTIIKTGD